MKSISALKQLSMKFINRETISFLIVGSVNTLASYLLYLLFLPFFNYSVSYTISYILGVFLSYFLNSVFVFKEPLSWKKALTFPVVYLAQYIISLVSIIIMVDILGMSEIISPLISIVITIPIVFIMSRKIIKGKSKNAF